MILIIFILIGKSFAEVEYEHNNRLKSNDFRPVSDALAILSGAQFK